MKEREVYRVVGRMWGEDGNRSLVQDFVNENPWKFNRLHELISILSNGMPKWTNNGWSPVEPQEGV